MSSRDTSPKTDTRPQRIPPWLRTRLPDAARFGGTAKMLAELGLHTVCQEALCPNRWECFSRHTATFLVLGPQCTRDCAFCNVTPGRPADPDPDEPGRVAEASRRLGLRHVVVTSVTRDDLPDGGAAHFAACIAAIRAVLPDAPLKTTVEVLIPDFQGDEAALDTVLAARPEVLNHNLETVRGLYPAMRPQADYDQSLELLARARAFADKNEGMLVKSGLMAGLGESFSGLMEAIADLARAGCHAVTVGQYMRPSLAHPPVERYLTPQEFVELEACGRHHGIPHMICAPKVRSSYKAADLLTNK